MSRKILGGVALMNLKEKGRAIADLWECSGSVRQVGQNSMVRQKWQNPRET
jgi:hypothetical protein